LRPSGAYTDDMGDFGHLTDLARDIRAAYVSPPDKETEARHLAAMAETVRAHADAELANQPRPRRRPRAWAIKEAFMTRTRTAALATKLAALTLVAVFATGGLAIAGVISLPNPLPDQASDRAEGVHDAIQGSDPSEERCAFGLSVAEAASDGHGNQPSSTDACEQEASQTEATADNGKSEQGDVEAQQNGAQPDPGAGREFGESISDRANGGEPQGGDGREFGESVSGEAKEFVDTPESQGGPETGETNSQEGQANAEEHAQGSPEAGQEKAGEHVPER
jgi:hypothetical protein